MSDDSPLARFRQSMLRDEERWREGIGYDLSAIAEASTEERAAIEQLLLQQQPPTWHDIEALAALDTPATRQALLRALESSDPEIRVAVSRFAAAVIGDDARTAALVYGLEHGTIFGGLTQALLEVESFHPPAIVAALHRGARNREGEVAIHLAAMLLYFGGVAEEPFDWNHRPFLLRFTEDDPVERGAAYAELCRMLGMGSP